MTTPRDRLLALAQEQRIQAERAGKVSASWITEYPSGDESHRFFHGVRLAREAAHHALTALDLEEIAAQMEQRPTFAEYLDNPFLVLSHPPAPEGADRAE